MISSQDCFLSESHLIHILLILLCVASIEPSNNVIDGVFLALSLITFINYHSPHYLDSLGHSTLSTLLIELLCPCSTQYYIYAISDLLKHVLEPQIV
jgi:hypothetical protein